MLVLLGLSACETVEISMRYPASDDKPSASPKQKPTKDNTFPGVGNNETVRLAAGTWRGDIRISSNRATVRGAGQGRTVIAGDVIITGNTVTMTGLTIRGSVTISGNNANLTGADIAGRVSDRGNKNAW
jgi:formylmethanofuran dehydrogenase subunit C